MRVDRAVAVTAAQPSRIPEVPQRTAARRPALPVVGRGAERPTRPAAFPERRQEAAQWSFQDRAARLYALLLSALLAQVERHFGIVLHLRQVDNGVAFLAVITQHQGIASTELTIVSRPSSSKRMRSARPASWRLCDTTTTAVSYCRARPKNNSFNPFPIASSSLTDGS